MPFLMSRWPRCGMNRYVSFLPLAAVAASCAVTSPTDSLDWAGFIAAFPGASHLQYEYVNGPTKVVGYADVPASISAGNARFERWCAVHGGRSDLAPRLASSSAAVSSFNNALGVKMNAERARGLPWKATVAVACVDRPTGRELVAAMVSEPGSLGEAREVQGKQIDKLTRAFFDKQQAADFATVYAQREEERLQRAAAESRDRVAARDAATRKLQLNPRIGDRTALGTIIDLRPPLALVQYDERYRSLSNRPAAEWLRIDGLSAASGGP